jgi:hypothetical protein
MQQIKKVVMITGVFLTLCFISLAAPTFADSVVKDLAEPFKIENGNGSNAVSIIQKVDVSKSRAEGGALLVDNTGNNNTGLTLYSNAGGTAVQPLMRMEIDNEAWNEEVLYIHSDSPTSRGLIRLDSPAPEIEFVETDQVGARGKFEVRVQHDAFQINSRRADDTTFENKISMTHEGDLELQMGSLFAKGTEPSEFAGGINVTGGCIAIDGTCVITSAKDVKSVPAKNPAAEKGAGTGAVAQMPLTKGEPDALSCNSNDERGAFRLDTENNRLYVCNGK